MLKAAGITAGTMLIAIGLSAQFGGPSLFKAPAGPRVAAGAPSPSVQPSPSPSPSAQATAPAEDQSMSVAGTIFPSWQGGGKKKHGK